MAKIEVITDFLHKGQRIILQTSRYEEFVKYLQIQTKGLPGWQHCTADQIKNFIIQLSEDRALNTFPVTTEPHDQIHDFKKVIDVGSGLAQTDLIWSQCLLDTDFYLVDNNDETTHSYSIIKDIIDHSPVNLKRIHFLDPTVEWPNDVDLIMSYWAWNWNIPKEMYWSKLLSSLKIGGFFASTFALNSHGIIDSISKDMNSQPCFYQPITIGKDYLNEDYFSDTISTGYYVWQRN